MCLYVCACVCVRARVCVCVLAFVTPVISIYNTVHCHFYVVFKQSPVVSLPILMFLTMFRNDYVAEHDTLYKDAK